jgi:peptide/nickel transport system substrate-binding protein
MTRSRTFTFTALLAALAIVVAACGGSSGSSGKGGGGGASGDEGKPVYGGKVVYGLEGKTTNFCIPSAQLAIAGIMVVNSIYDTLTVPTNTPDKYQPYLAKSVTPNADYTEWTIVNRSGVTFQDGTPLTADIIKQNIDAWRGGILLGFVFSNIADTQVTAPDTVVVKMKVPWVAFPAYLWTTGRTGIAAPAQLNDEATCDTNMIGTGPFQILNGGSFDPATGDVKAVKNPNYWRKGFPYLDEIDFKPQEESSQRVNGLQGGQFDLIHGSGGVDLDQVQSLSGVDTTIEPDGRMEISHTLPNVTHPPLDDVNVRKALIMGVDRNALNQIANKGTYRITDQVFDTDIMG